MHPFIENFLERPTSHKAGFWAGSILLISFVFWQYFYGAALKEQDELSNKVQSLTTEIATEKRLARDLGKFRDQVKELDIKLNQALQELPDTREIPDFLRSISDLAREVGLEVPLFRPLPEVRKDFYAEVPVSITVEGTFHQVATFFDEVGRLPRIVNISGITVREPKIGEDRVVIRADCSATTFRYLDESERVQAAATDPKKRKRK